MIKSYKLANGPVSLYILPWIKHNNMWNQYDMSWYDFYFISLQTGAFLY